MKRMRTICGACALAAAVAAFGEIAIRSDYPGGHVKVCGGVYSFPAARELGRNMLKALVRTAQGSEKP